MAQFQGFPEGKTHQTPIPDLFFRDLLALIDDLGELKLTLYFFWRLDQMEGNFRYLRREDLLNDEEFMRGFGAGESQRVSVLDGALEMGVSRGTILIARVKPHGKEEELYFLNTPRGRAAVQAAARGELQFGLEDRLQPVPQTEAPNIYRLYEENVGPLTPLIADALRDAENTYPASWLEEAFRIAVENNARNWRYIQAILNRWQTEGRDERKNRQDSEKDRRRYVEGEFADYIEH